MSLKKRQMKESGIPSWNRIEITSDGPTNDRLCKQIEELTKRVGHLESTVKKLEAKIEMTKDRCRPTQTNTIPATGSLNRSFIKQKSLHIKLVDMNSPENDKTPKSPSTKKDEKPTPASSSPLPKSPPKVESTSTASMHNRKPQPVVSKTSSQVDPFMSRKNLASIAHTPAVQNGDGTTDPTSKESPSPVKSFAKRYEELSRSQTNLKRMNSQSETEVVTLHFDKRKSNPESKKTQITLIPQNKDILSSSLKANPVATNEVKSNTPPVLTNEVKSNNPPVLTNEVKSNNSPVLTNDVKSKNSSPVATNEVKKTNNSPPVAPQPPKSPLPVNGPPAAPPLPKAEPLVNNSSKNSDMNGSSDGASVKSQSRNVEPANGDVPHDALMDQLKQFADKGFPFKRQITKQTHLKSNTWNFSKKGNKG